MPVTLITNQVTPSTQQPFSNQSSFGQAVGEVSSYNPGMSSSLVMNYINNVARDYYDRRNWYGLLRKGQFVSPGYFSTGTVTLTNGSNTVQGNNTNWTPSLNGASILQQQLRVGFTSPILNIIGFNQASQQITIELPWGLPSQSTSGYWITQYYYSVPNIKYIYSVKNLQLMYRIWSNVPQSLLENWDPSRLQFMYPRVLASMPPDVNGNTQFEMWPAPNTQQAFPYLAYVYPDNLVSDSDNFPAFTRVDVIKARAIAEVLRYRPKQNSAYSEAAALSLAKEKIAEYDAGMASATQADEALWRQDIITQAEMMPMANLDWGSGMLLGGSTMAAMTATMADDY
jgi:hypothetical protein